MERDARLHVMPQQVAGEARGARVPTAFLGTLTDKALPVFIRSAFVETGDLATHDKLEKPCWRVGDVIGAID